MAFNGLLPIEAQMVERVLNEAKGHGFTSVTVIFNDHKIVDIQCANHVAPKSLKKIYETPLDSFVNQG